MYNAADKRANGVKNKIVSSEMGHNGVTYCTYLITLQGDQVWRKLYHGLILLLSHTSLTILSYNLEGKKTINLIFK